MLDSRSLLCFVTCTDGSTYTLRSCIKGGLVEANEQLVDHPELLAQKVCRSGKKKPQKFILLLEYPRLASSSSVLSKMIMRNATCPFLSSTSHQCSFSMCSPLKTSERLVTRK